MVQYYEAKKKICQCSYVPIPDMGCQKWLIAEYKRPCKIGDSPLLNKPMTRRAEFNSPDSAPEIKCFDCGETGRILKTKLPKPEKQSICWIYEIKSD